MQTRTDTCARNFSIAFKMLRYIMSGSANFLRCILCTLTLPFQFIIMSGHIYISQIHLCKSKILPMTFMCSSLLSAFSDPHDTKPMHHLYSTFVLTQRVLTTCCWEKCSTETHMDSWSAQHSSKYELKDSRWYQGMNLGTEGRMWLQTGPLWI